MKCTKTAHLILGLYMEFHTEVHEIYFMICNTQVGSVHRKLLATFFYTNLPVSGINEIYLK
jgi:hypothetical protein